MAELLRSSIKKSSVGNGSVSAAPKERTDHMPNWLWVVIIVVVVLFVLGFFGRGRYSR
jgi:hypothetical protein